MNRFDYIRPASIQEAVAEGSVPGTAYLGAGTNLLDLMKTGALRPGRVVDLTHLPGMNEIDDLPDGGLRIGALVRNADLARDDRVETRFPAVAEALLAGASGQLRNAATVGGNLMQHTRCAYFTDPTSPCNRREPGSGCSAIGGETRGFAVLGASDACIATHPSDFCVALAALGATVEVAGRDGTRDLPLDELHLLPGDTPERIHALAPGEIVTALRLPGTATVFAGNQRYLKLRDRTSYAFALVSVCAALSLEGGRVAGARIALGAVAAKPWRAHAAETALQGAAPSRETWEAAAKAALRDAEPTGGNAFKVDLAERLVVRALMLAAAGTPDELPALPGSVHAPQGGYQHA